MQLGKLKKQDTLIHETFTKNKILFALLILILTKYIQYIYIY